jgi:hypothetical protein
LLKNEGFLRDQGKRYQEMKEKFTWLVEYKNVLIKSEEAKHTDVDIRYQI